MSLFNYLINSCKKHRKYKQLSVNYNHQYAFVGIGNHSLNNLYPVLDYLKVPLKYIVTKTKKTTDLLNEYNHKSQATNDFNLVLNDPEIKGIFISTNPNEHYSLIHKALTYKKMCL